MLNVIRELTRSGMTILIVTHEMGFAREVSDRVLFICDGVIREEGTPEQIFTCPHDPSTIKFTVGIPLILLAQIALAQFLLLK